MEGMRVDNSDHGRTDRGFGLGAREPERPDVTADDERIAHGVGAAAGQTLGERFGQGAEAGQGLLDSIGDDAEAVSFGGHVEVGHLEHDFGHDGLHEGLDGLHDSVSDSVGLGFEGDEHHSLHESLSEGLHEDTHDSQPDAHDHDGRLGDLFDV